jgi:hypothetical protein
MAEMPAAQPAVSADREAATGPTATEGNMTVVVMPATQPAAAPGQEAAVHPAATEGSMPRGRCRRHSPL